MKEKTKNFLLKNVINILIDKILIQEDELNKYTNIKDNQILLSTISKNNERIEALSNLIEKEKNIAEEKIKNIEEKKFGFQQEILKLIEPKVKYHQKDFEQNLIKEKFLIKTINIHENEIDSINENLRMLKEEKIIVSNDLLNLMNLRESLEDIIKIKANKIFKIRKKVSPNKKPDYDEFDNDKNNYIENNLNLDNDNINIEQIRIETHDILNIPSVNKLSNYIYKIIATNIASNFTSLLIELNLKNIIYSCLENGFNKYIKNNKNLKGNKASNFIRELSVNIVNYNLKTSNIFIQPQFELLLKCIFKLFSLEKTINSELKFVNNDYNFNKNILKNKKLDIEKKINDCSKQKADLASEKKLIQNDCDIMENYLNKINELKNSVNIQENEIKRIMEELNLSLSVYQKQIDGLSEENINLENKFKNYDFSYKIENINKQIDFLFKGIKTKIHEINDKEEKDKLINDMIEDINNCLEPNNNINIHNKYNSNNLLNFNSIPNIKKNINYIKYEDAKKLEDDEISENELLSSYNSLNIFNNANKENIYHKKSAKKDSKKLNFRLETDDIPEQKFNNEHHSFINSSNNNHHPHYLKLSDFFQFNN